MLTALALHTRVSLLFGSNAGACCQWQVHSQYSGRRVPSRLARKWTSYLENADRVVQVEAESRIAGFRALGRPRVRELHVWDASIEY